MKLVTEMKLVGFGNADIKPSKVWRSWDETAADHTHNEDHISHKETVPITNRLKKYSKLIYHEGRAWYHKFYEYPSRLRPEWI